MAGTVVERLPLLGRGQKMIQVLIDFPRSGAIPLIDYGPVGTNGISHQV